MQFKRTSYYLSFDFESIKIFLARLKTVDCEEEIDVLPWEMYT